MSTVSPRAYRRGVWKYDRKDWHSSCGLTLEEWRAGLAAEGWEPELPELAEGAELVHGVAQSGATRSGTGCRTARRRPSRLARRFRGDARY